MAEKKTTTSNLSIAESLGLQKPGQESGVVAEANKIADQGGNKILTIESSESSKNVTVQMKVHSDGKGGVSIHTLQSDGQSIMKLADPDIRSIKALVDPGSFRDVSAELAKARLIQAARMGIDIGLKDTFTPLTMEEGEQLLNAGPEEGPDLLGQVEAIRAQTDEAETDTATIQPRKP